MDTDKLTNMLLIISEKLSEKEVPFCLIGAMALGIFGLPRYTSDIDLLANQKDWYKISLIMEKLGYTCFQKSDVFAQFDSELGVYGKVDFMLVQTNEGRDIIKRSIIIDDFFSPITPVVQPTDYVILKLMAMANNPDRNAQDEADISSCFDLLNNDLLPKRFNPIDIERILLFADKFGKQSLIQKYLDKEKAIGNGKYTL